MANHLGVFDAIILSRITYYGVCALSGFFYLSNLLDALMLFFVACLGTDFAIVS